MLPDIWRPTVSNLLSYPLAYGLLALLLLSIPAGIAGADQPGTSERWNAVLARGEVDSLDAAPAAAQALLDWLRSEGGQLLLDALITEGRAEQRRGGQSTRREIGASGYIDSDGSVVMLRALVCSEWYTPSENACVEVGKASRGVPWAVHTHGWGNSMSGLLRGITDDFAYATNVGGRPGVLICLPLREADGSERVDSGRFQMVAPVGAAVGCYEGRWFRRGPELAIASGESKAVRMANRPKRNNLWLTFRRLTSRANDGG